MLTVSDALRALTGPAASARTVMAATPASQYPRLDRIIFLPAELAPAER